MTVGRIVVLPMPCHIQDIRDNHPDSPLRPHFRSTNIFLYMPSVILLFVIIYVTQSSFGKIISKHPNPLHS